MVLGTGAKVPEFLKIAKVSPRGVDEDDEEESSDESDDDEESGDEKTVKGKQDEWSITDGKLNPPHQCLRLRSPLDTMLTESITGKGAIPLYRWPAEEEELHNSDDSDNEAEKESVPSRRFNRFGRTILPICYLSSLFGYG